MQHPRPTHDLKHLQHPRPTRDLEELQHPRPTRDLEELTDSRKRDGRHQLSRSGPTRLVAASQGRICDVPVNTDLPVHTAWDIGVDDAMAIWCFQAYPDHLDIVDY